MNIILRAVRATSVVDGSIALDLSTQCWPWMEQPDEKSAFSNIFFYSIPIPRSILLTQYVTCRRHQRPQDTSLPVRLQSSLGVAHHLDHRPCRLTFSTNSKVDIAARASVDLFRLSLPGFKPVSRSKTKAVTRTAKWFFSIKHCIQQAKGVSTSLHKRSFS